MLFYKESSIKNLLKCQNCQHYLEEHKPVRITKCGKTVCTKCNENYILSAMLSNNDCYKCNFCGLNHELKANGLIINEILSDLINHKPEKVTRGKENEHLEINEIFYKQSIVESTFKCQQCKQANFEYEEARILACGKTV